MKVEPVEINRSDQQDLKVQDMTCLMLLNLWWNRISLIQTVPSGYVNKAYDWSHTRKIGSNFKI